MSNSTHSSYTLVFSNSAGTDYTWGFGFQSSDLITVYHYTDFSETASIVEIKPLGGTQAVTSIVTVSSFTVSYNTTTYRSYSSSQSLYVTGNSTAGTSKLTFGGQHQGVFLRQQWHVRNDEFDFDRNHTTGTETGYDGVDEFRGKYDVAADYTTVRKSRDEIRQALPKGFYQAYRFVPDRTTMTSIVFTVRCSVGGKPVTFTAAQTVRNDWSKMLKEVRDFVYEGKGESKIGYVTKYNQGGTWTDFTISSMTVTNTAQIGSGAVIKVFTTAPINLYTGNTVRINVNSKGTNHSLANGEFPVISVLSSTCFTYTATSTGTISTTTSLTATAQYLQTDIRVVLPTF